FVADARIEHHQQLAHAGDERDFGEFASRSQLAIEGLEFGLPANGNQSGHVEGGAHTGPSSKDAAMSAQGTAIAVQWRDTDKFRNLLARQRSELWKQAKQGRLSDGSESLDGAPRRGKTRRGERGDVLVEFGALLFQSTQTAQCGFSKRGQGQGRDLLLLLLHGNDELSTSDDVSGKRALPRFGLDITRQACVQAVSHMRQA